MNLFIEFLQTIKKMGLEYYKVYYGYYPAQVSNTEDPEQRGRIKVIVPSILGDKELAQWISAADYRMAGKKSGEFMPPYKGDWITVIFEHGHLSSPKYIAGGFYAKDELLSDFKDGYEKSKGPQVRGWIFQNGTKILIDETSGKEKVLIQNKDKTKFQLSADPLLSATSIETANGTKITIDDRQKTSVEMSTKTGTTFSLGKDGADEFTLMTNEGAQVQADKGGGVTINDSSKKLSVTMSKNKVDVKAGSDTLSMGSGKIEINSSGDVSVTAKGNAKVDASQVEISAKTQLKVAGKAQNEFGSDSGITDVKGSIVKIAKGVKPVASVGSMVMVIGNQGAPATGQVTVGSPKVLVP